MRDAHQRLRIAVFIGLAEQQVGRQRQGRRALHARFDPQRLGAGIGADDVVRIDQRQGLRSLLRRQGGGKRFERQPRQMETDPQHRRTPITPG
jgi:hypothetical protein